MLVAHSLHNQGCAEKALSVLMSTTTTTRQMHFFLILFLFIASTSWMGVVLLLLHINDIRIQLFSPTAQPQLDSPEKPLSAVEISERTTTTNFLTQLNQMTINLLGTQTRAYICYGVVWLVLVCILVAFVVGISGPVDQHLIVKDK